MNWIQTAILYMVHTVEQVVGYVILREQNMMLMHIWMLKHAGNCKEKAQNLAESESRLCSWIVLLDDFCGSGVSAGKRHCIHCYCSPGSLSGLGWKEGLIEGIILQGYPAAG